MPGASFEKSVKGATKTKNAAPKSKYIEHILTATYSEAGVAEIFRTLQYRIRDSTWTIVYKALIVVHMMIREGSAGAALKYLAQHPRLLIVTSISEVQAQGLNIWRYSEYLISRANAFAETKTDFVRGGEGRLKRLTVSKGLLRETEIVQKQIHALVKCDLLMDEPDNEISLTAFRLLTLDLLTLYSVMNEGTINILENYFEMSRPDTERALKIYKRFSAQTEDVVKFLRIARQFESATRLAIPNLKHASTDLAKLLEDDLNDPDFDLRRREYRAQKFGTSSEEKEKGVARSRSVSAPQKSKPAPVSAQTAPPKLEVKSSGPNLIDFFDSTDQPQQKQLSMLQQTPQQQQFNPLTLQFQQPQQMQPQQFQQTGFQLQQTGFSPQSNFQQPQQFMQQMTGLGQQQQQTGFGGPIRTIEFQPLWANATAAADSTSTTITTPPANPYWRRIRRLHPATTMEHLPIGPPQHPAKWNGFVPATHAYRRRTGKQPLPPIHSPASLIRHLQLLPAQPSFVQPYALLHKPRNHSNPSIYKPLRQTPHNANPSIHKWLPIPILIAFYLPTTHRPPP
ncbi:ENTH domain-containing protein, variant [Blastomyces gilchristii SLH14081]|uniref:ENTH domain-containing protein n=1 Tax=Blastomyces gilchristii (strain SLH14081) TaxID=559298 RepID=A0A179V242_BLAGS|nr:ENTH domain-containing protein [Blastomyces gilchristii SLH14081]XP_031581419.1 ENTH domain-containing protein, variant [Blastomyces gilchristii SLH14081]OAT14404.1 ENTH domain-containing protein [Blastomyces gilchristii SLH14081]OAT14405.1 ENTH domain-containing protein, variant [Blastomyces gilchristii SLH14081]